MRLLQPQSWTLIARLEGAARPPPDGGDWVGDVKWLDGRRFEGRLRGLCPLQGVETDPGGARFAVTYDGRRSLAEDLVTTARQVTGWLGLCRL